MIDGLPPITTAAIPTTISYVTFSNRTTTAPNERSGSWDAVAALLTRHARRPGKDGPAWSPAVYKRGKNGQLLTRANASVHSLTCAVADVDHIELDDVVSLREHIRELGLACVIYSTHSSTEDAPRVRIAVPLAESAPADLWPRLWPTLAQQIFLGLTDRAASDAARLYYLPAAPADSITIAERLDGEALVWRDLPLADPRPVATAATTAGAGPSPAIDPQDMPILEQLFSGRRGEQRLRVWMGDCSDFKGDASAGDQSLANGLVVYCRGDVERAERIMRSGPWRPKWDDPRGATTVLGFTLGKALAAYRAWAGSREESQERSLAVDETPEQTIARLQHELANARAISATQQTVILAERARRETAEVSAREGKETVQLIRDVIAWDGAEAPQKLVILATLFEAHSRASRSIDTLPNVRLIEMTGLKENKVSECSQDFAGREGSPLKRWNDREWVRDEESGELAPKTHTRFTLAHESLNDSLRAVVRMGPPTPKAQKAREDARERARKGRQWGECPDCKDGDVQVIGSCKRHPQNIVGDRVMSREEFKLLERPRHEFRDADGRGAPVTGRLTKDPGIRDAGGEAQYHEVRDVGQVVTLFPPETAPRGEISGPRCGEIKRSGYACTSTVYGDLGSGWGRCLGCGAKQRMLPAVAGGAD